MKARVPRLNCKQQGEIRQLVKREVANFSKQWEQDFEVMMIWCLHKYYGFGLKRMLEFRKRFIAECKELRSRYEMEAVYPARLKLKDMGYDVEALQAQDDEEAALLTAEETTERLNNK